MCSIPVSADKVQRAMQDKRGHSANDPWCIGYFSDNEMSWGDDTSLALGALGSPAEQAAKIVFIADLKAKYGDISNLNTAWGTRHDSWNALLTNRAAPDPGKARRRPNRVLLQGRRNLFPHRARSH